MRDQENPKDKWIAKPLEPDKPLPPTLANEQTTWAWYIRESEAARNAIGITKEGGKLVVKNQKLIDKLELWQKEFLRDLWKELAAKAKS